MRLPVIIINDCWEYIIEVEVEVIRHVTSITVVVFSSDVSSTAFRVQYAMASSEYVHTVNPLVSEAILSQSDVFAELCD